MSLPLWQDNGKVNGVYMARPVDSLRNVVEAVEIARVRGLARSGRARAIRQQARLSQAEIAQAVGVHEATIARWESGTRAPRGAAALRWGSLLRELVEVAP